jgi:hypothetical protein
MVSTGSVKLGLGFSRHVLCVVAAVALAGLIGAGDSRAAEFPQYDLKADPAAVADKIPADLKSGRYTLWLPEGHEKMKIRGIIVVVDYQDGASLWADSKNTHMRKELDEIMTENSFGMMLEYVINPDAQSKLYKNPANDWAARGAFHALKHYAGVTKHPELAYAPVLWTGLSQSGGTAYLKSRLAPARTIGAIAYHAAVGQGDNSPAYGVPILSPMGARDSLSKRSVGLFTAAVPAGALWLPYVQAGTEHHRLDQEDNHEMEYEWLKWVIKARVPKDVAGDAPVELIPLKPQEGYYVRAGFTGEGTAESHFKFDKVEVVPASAGKPSDAVGWIPNAELAQVWMKRVQAATVGTVTMKQSPLSKPASGPASKPATRPAS